MTAEEMWKDMVKNTPIDDYAIDRLLGTMQGIEEKKTTPKKTSTVLLEASATIIRQRLEIKALKNKLEKMGGDEE